MPSPRTNRMFEIAITQMIEGWKLYADAHKSAYDSEIGEDSVIGEEWQDLGMKIRSLVGLGERGKLDGRDTVRLINKIAYRNGIDFE